MKITTLCPWCGAVVHAQVVGFSGYGGYQPELEFDHSCDRALTRVTAREVHVRLESRLEAAYYEAESRARRYAELANW